MEQYYSKYNLYNKQFSFVFLKYYALPTIKIEIKFLLIEDCINKKYLIMESEPNIYYENIQNNMYIIIRNDLTIGRIEDGLKPFTEKEILSFIKDNSTDINEAIHSMYMDYLEDDKLDLLKMPQMVWFTEYLYDYVAPHSNP